MTWACPWNPGALNTGPWDFGISGRLSAGWSCSDVGPKSWEGRLPRVIVPKTLEVVEFKLTLQLWGDLKNGTKGRILSYGEVDQKFGLCVSDLPPSHLEIHLDSSFA